ncbi:MAG: T9SS type A sorting domain-containing protein [Ignavibacteria bacterium]|nr:T9SS type A sorting domain-containing protein [Ignavibacteria bacterium]
MRRFIFSSVLFFFFTSISFPQYSDPNLRRVGFLNGNNLHLSFYNDGQISGFNQGVDIRGKWKGNDYIGDMIPMIGVELPIKDYNNDGKADTIHSVIISRGPRKGQGNEKDPTTNAFLGFNPKPGYLDTTIEKIPMSNDPSSWPLSWKDHPEWGSNVWDGLYGKNFFAGDVETYLKIDDNSDTEVFRQYGFLPDSTISHRKGFGISVGIRYIQSAKPDFNDVIFKVYDIKNEGTTTYNKVFYGDIIGTLVGGDGDSGDDLGSIDSTTNTVYSYDNDGIGNHGQKVGVMSETLIEAPTSNNIASYSFFNVIASPDMSDDEFLWKRLSPGSFDKYPAQPMDGDIFWGTTYFSLAPGETKRVITVIAMGDSIPQVESKVLLAKVLWCSKFNYDYNNIAFIGFSPYRILKNSETINWTSKIMASFVDIYFSSDAGDTWRRIAENLSNNGSFLLNTKNYQDCSLGKLKIVEKDINQTLIGLSESPYFIIDNEKNGAPFVKILNYEDYNDSSLVEDNISLNLMVGDPENKTLSAKAYYTSTNELIETFNIDPTFSTTKELSLRKLPNSESASISIEISDDSSTVFAVTNTFKKLTSRTPIAEKNYQYITWLSDAKIAVNVIDSSKVTGNSYLVTFNDTTNAGVLANVFNETTQQNVLTQIPLDSTGESLTFDGLSFVSNRIGTFADVDRTYLSTLAPPNTFSLLTRSFDLGSSIKYHCYSNPNDYKIIFYNNIVDTSINIKDIVNTSSATNLPPIPINFKIFNTTKNMELKAGVFKSGTFYSDLNIFLVEKIGNIEKVTWNIIVRGVQPQTYPAGGDTLYFFTQKGLSINDSLRISGNLVNVFTEEMNPSTYQLIQNYPNPFNPTTTISYNLPKSGLVNLVIYDVLGKEIKRLVSEYKQAGTYKINFDASSLASGVYFYSLRANDYTSTKKMLLLK